MKILIIGGTRFLGYHIAGRLIGDGHELTLFNRGLTPDDLGRAVNRVRGDRLDRRDFSLKLGRENWDVVIDMIAYEAEDSRSAVETFAGRAGHFIHISTGSVYVVTRDFPCPLREEDFDRELYPRPKKNAEWWLYGYHKRGCEEVLREAYAKRGFPVTILRLPVVMGERDYTLRAYSYFLRLADGLPLVLPDAGLNVFTHIYQGDVAATVAANLRNGAAFGQAYNLAQGEIVSLRGFVLEAARIMGRRPDLVDIPTDVLEQTSLGTGFSPFSTRRPFVLACQKAQRDLAFSSTPFPVWLGRTIRWFQDEYKGGPPGNYGRRQSEVMVSSRYREAIRGIARPRRGATREKTNG
jgi:nucleoside-diphosphate-sugar epimerase